jgi:hypothetical protein
MIQKILLLLIVTLLPHSHLYAEKSKKKPPKWVLIAEDALSSQTDLYIDVNSRYSIGGGRHFITTLEDHRGRKSSVEVFRDDGTGEQYSVYLHDKKYRSVVTVEIFDCISEESGLLLTRYKSKVMGRGKNVYKEDYSQEQDDGGMFIPTMEIYFHEPGAKKAFRFACEGVVP